MPTDPAEDVITDARYLTFGCTSAIAASEALCTLIEQGGFTPIQALEVSNQDIVDFLGGLPQQKIHCSVMGAEALEAAVFNWAQKRGVDLQQLGVDLHADEGDEGRIVCKCFTLTEPYIRRKIKELNLRTIPEITNAIKAGGACMACHHIPGGLQDLLDEAWGGGKRELKILTQITLPSTEPVSGPEAGQSGSGERSRPTSSPRRSTKSSTNTCGRCSSSDGGNLEIVDIKDMLVYCRLAGSCEGCSGAGQTLRMLVERTLKEMVDERVRVIDVREANVRITLRRDGFSWTTASRRSVMSTLHRDCQ